MERFANAARSTLTASIGDDDLAAQVDDPSVFPADGIFRCVIVESSGVHPEIVKVTAVAGDIFTIERAAEVYAGDQTAYEHEAGAIIAQVITDAGLAAAFGSIISERSPENISDGRFDLRIPTEEDGVTTGTFTLRVNDEVTAPITWDPDPGVTAQNAVDAINALPGIDGAAELD